MLQAALRRSEAGGNGSDEIGRENAALRRLVAACQHLSSLAAQDADLQAVTELIAERAGTAVAVVDKRLVVTAACNTAVPEEKWLVGQSLTHPGIAQVAEAVSRTRRAVRIPDVAGTGAIIVAPVPVGDEVAAFLLALDAGEQGDGKDLRLLLTEHAAVTCGAVLSRERVVAAAATQARHDLVEGLLSGRGSDPETVGRWAAHLGYDKRRPYRVLSIVTDCREEDDVTRRVLTAVERFFTAQVPEAITAIRGDEAVIVLPEPDPASPRSSRMANACISRVGKTFRGVVLTAGIGEVCHSAMEIAQSYDGARRALEIVVRAGKAGTAVAMEDLGVQRLLLEVADVDQLRTFAHHVFGGFLNHGKGNEAEYLSTLACYFRRNSSLQAVAGDLRVHPNTVRYRIRRVEELAALDLSDYRDRLMAQVALEILDLLGDLP